MSQFDFSSDGVISKNRRQVGYIQGDVIFCRLIRRGSMFSFW